MFHNETPIVSRRGIHLDLKGLPPTFGRLMKLLDLFAAARINFVLVEWEDAFPWTADERFRSPTAYLKDEVDAFAKRARELGIEVIPLVQCLGHMETPLRLAEYAHLRELPERCDVLNPLAMGARELVERMIEDVLARSGQISHFHLGGDEAWTFGSHPDTRAFIEKHGKAALYLQHVEPLLDRLNARGIRPILWHDMMHDWPAESLRRLGSKCDLMFWWYRGHTDQAPEKFHTRVIEHFESAKVPLWGACAYKGADSRGDADRPDVPQRVSNAMGWADVSAKHALKGVVATAWSRYSTFRVQCEPIDGALDALLKVAGVLHDGVEPADQACEAILKQSGQWERFIPIRDALKLLADARRQCREFSDLAKQQACLEKRDPARAGSGALDELRRHAREHLAKAEKAADLFRDAALDLVPRIWLDEYIAERIEPLRLEATL
jgi:hexosaminidase